MKHVGIIAEYNPFHLGHAHQIAQTRRQVGECAVVCVMSGNWVQRGECAIANKWSRAARALSGGADLVLELPTPWAAASAEAFAQGAVGALADTGVVDILSFGSELGVLDDLHTAARCLNSAAFPPVLHTYLERGLSFAAARQHAVEDLVGPAGRCLAQPNNNLAVEYLRALPEGIAPLTVPRRGGAHDGAPAEGFASASSIRHWLRGGQTETANTYLPQPWAGEMSDMAHIERAVLACLRRTPPDMLATLPGGGEGLANRLTDAGRDACTLEAVYARAKTKRYAHARIRRVVLWAFLGLDAASRPERVPYLRVLGFNERGREALREMKTCAAVPIITKPAHVRQLPPAAQALFAAESRCTDLYGLCFPQVVPGGQEWRCGPVVHTAP